MKELQETSRLQKETTKSHQDPDTQGVPSGPKGIRAGKGLQGTSLPNIIGRSPAVAQNKFKGSQNLSSRASAEIPTPSSTTERLDFTMPRIDTKYIPVNHSGTPFTIGSTYPPHQVGTSSLRVQWSRKLGIQTRSYASAVLYALSQKAKPAAASPPSLPHHPPWKPLAAACRTTWAYVSHQKPLYCFYLSPFSLLPPFRLHLLFPSTAPASTSGIPILTLFDAMAPHLWQLNPDRASAIQHCIPFSAHRMPRVGPPTPLPFTHLTALAASNSRGSLRSACPPVSCPIASS